MIKPYKQQYLPNNDVAERGLLKAILQDNHVFSTCKDCGITADSFYVRIHRIIFEAMEEVWKANACRTVNITEENIIKSAKNLGEKYLGYECDNIEAVLSFIKGEEDSLKLVTYFIDILKEKQYRREMLKLCQDNDAIRGSDLLANSLVYKNSKYINFMTCAPCYTSLNKNSAAGYVIQLYFPEDFRDKAYEMLHALRATSKASDREAWAIMRASEMIRKAAKEIEKPVDKETEE